MQIIFETYFFLLFSAEKAVFGKRWANSKKNLLVRITNVIILLHFVAFIFLFRKFVGLQRIEIILWLGFVVYQIYISRKLFGGDTYIIALTKMENIKQTYGRTVFLLIILILPTLIFLSLTLPHRIQLL
ncbi:hypothetical protein ASG14_19650 [Pedobacter sp. Leaf194]|nr:hypothetical protein ASG14_19650 [Pedobacter sp. Leaf194]